MSKKIRRILFILFFTLIALAGGTFIGVLIYLDASGLLNPIIQTLLGYFSFGGKGVLIIFWAILLPVLLLAFVIFLFLRRRRVDKVRDRWERGLERAIQAERTAYAAELGRRFPPRFKSVSTLPVTVQNGKKVNTLGEFCTGFRNFSAANLRLYFSESEVREFIAGLAASKILILQGISGAGKTSLAYAFGEYIGNPSTIIPVQPMWKERSDLLGYYNEFTKNFNETVLFKKLYEAGASDAMYITVLDEMNIARIEYYFAEFLSLLEIPDPDLRYLQVVSDKWANDPEWIKDGAVKLPQNMWFIGTVNDDDSAFVISDKVYDRAMILNLTGHSEPMETPEGQPVSVTCEEFNGMVKTAQAGFALSAESCARIETLDKFLADKFRISYGNRIKRQITEYVAAYVACGGTEEEALDDILAKKVLRKLGNIDVSKYTDELQKLSALLDNMPGGSMPRCLEYIEKVQRYE